MAEIFLLTGPFLSGKTSFCFKLFSELEKRGKDVRGIISQADFEGGRKVRIWALGLPSLEKRLLAEKKGQGLAIPQLWPWVFKEDAIFWVNSQLKAAIPCQVLIVDELGPLEFQFQEGFQEAFAAIDSQKFHLALAVVRTELLNLSLKRWPQAKILKIEDAEKWSQEVLHSL
jgi:nucleoside-triphosphatase THEP1